LNIGFSNSAGFKFMVRPPFHFLDVTSKLNLWRLPASPARFSKATIFRMPPAQIPGPQARKIRLRRAQVLCKVRSHADWFVWKISLPSEQGREWRP
jgi:hypothetical protein